MAYRRKLIAKLKWKTVLKSESSTSFFLVSAPVNPLSTSDVESVMKIVVIPMTPKSDGVSNLANTTLAIATMP